MNRSFSLILLSVAAVALIADLPAHAKFEKSSSVGDQTIHVERDLSGRIILSAASCDILESQVTGLSDWSTKLGDNHSAGAACTCEEGNEGNEKCQVDVTKVVPDVVRKLQGFLPEYTGPNCWNAALVIGKIVPELRYSDPSEMTFWLDSPLCRELPADEKSKAGDIVAVRDKDGVEQHAYIYVTEQIAFSKNGAENTAPYTLESPWNVLFRYDVREGCRKVLGDVDPRCPNYTNFYDCEPLDDFMSGLKTAPTQKFQETSSEVSDVEMQLSNLALHGDHKKYLFFSTKQNPSALKAALTNRIAVLRMISEEEVKKPHTADEEFLWKSLTVRLDSTAQQIKDIE